MAPSLDEYAPEKRQVTHVMLNHLLLDDKNPRFGLQNRSASQEQILDRIVEKFGVDDVLSSLAVNGYFEAEPLVCRRVSESADLTVVEGNRRLAACLIITKDGRSSNQAKRSAEFSRLWEEHGRQRIDPVPAITFDADEQEKEILSYLGVRHIASAQPWDSYAKAAWVAQVVEFNELNIKEVSRMIGDRHRTVNRMLEGYYLVRQLTDEGKFNQQDSLRRGRGSVTDYPFSWVYTILGYTAIRNFLELTDTEAHSDPIEEKNLDNAALLLRSMFGDKSRGRSAAISDSRQIGSLASAFADREKVRLLEQGKTLSEIDVLTQPIEQRLSEGLGVIRDTLRDLIAGLSEQDIPQEVASELIPASGRIRRMAAELDRKLREAASGDDDDE